MLSQVASLFDPLGLVGPVIVKAKIMLQRLWEDKLDYWDESVPVDIATSWSKYREQVELLNNFIVPRQVTTENVINVQLHGFCDASERAYGAVLYLRSTTFLGIHTVRLICSKTRVAPIKKVTLPRLELSAADLLGKLRGATIKSLKIEIEKEFFWSDSTIALHWIQTSPHRLKTFVANRVSHIQENTQHRKWRHVPSQDNPADALSKGQFPREFVNNPIWKSGPCWLSKDEAAWPLNLIPSIEIPEQRSIVVLSNVHGVDTDLFLRFSSFAKIKRVIARCIRFASKCRSLEVASGDLSVGNLGDAEMRIMRLVQLSAFESELRSLREKRLLDKKSRILSLSPFLDVDGVLRVEGRLSHADLTFAQKHPILLPANNHVSELIIRETHIKLCHAGSQATLYAIRENYWLRQSDDDLKNGVGSAKNRRVNEQSTELETPFPNRSNVDSRTHDDDNVSTSKRDVERHPVRILERRYLLTKTRYKFIDVGITAVLPCYVHIVIGDCYGKEISLSPGTWKKLVDQKRAVLSHLQRGKNERVPPPMCIENGHLRAYT
ncbi:uncharacterized protein LOC112468531 [Temnothorax curvispinosus]|uniref:Uncharacterized protein LOC112468531 n=1 Tax=Temnothorax curvispinosus TaxID=300111 RepID=A0A6J1RGQ1_9HYME|nr:uncharacterized protein LOC112468531 [Temnothorax curvispinosus]